jgi:hypothetical protein
MKFLYTYACLILLFSTTGNCKDLPADNAALITLYKTKNNGLTPEDVVKFLVEAVKLNNRDMVKTIMSPPKQKHITGEKDNNPKVSQDSVNEFTTAIMSGKLGGLTGIDGYLQLIGEDETTQENINSAFIKFAENNNTGMCRLILQQDTKPDQEAINKVFILFAENNNTGMCKHLLQQDIKPDQSTINNAFVIFAESATIDMCKHLLQQDIKPEQAAINKAFIQLADKNEKHMCTLLLKLNIKPDQTAMNGAFKAFANKGDTDMCKFLLQQDIKPDQEAMNSAFYSFAYKGDADMCKHLLQQNIKLNQKTVNTAFEEFSKKFNTEMCTLLLQQDIKPEQDSMGRGLLKFLSITDSDKFRDICMLILQQDIKPNEIQIQHALDSSIRGDFADIFSLLAGLVEERVVLNAAEKAGENGSVKVLQKILKDYPIDEVKVSEVLTKTANKFKNTHSSN